MRPQNQRTCFKEGRSHLYMRRQMHKHGGTGQHSIVCQQRAVRIAQRVQHLHTRPKTVSHASSPASRRTCMHLTNAHKPPVSTSARQEQHRQLPFHKIAISTVSTPVALQTTLTSGISRRKMKSRRPGGASQRSSPLTWQCTCRLAHPPLPNCHSASTSSLHPSRCTV